MNVIKEVVIGMAIGLAWAGTIGLFVFLCGKVQRRWLKSVLGWSAYLLMFVPLLLVFCALVASAYTDSVTQERTAENRLRSIERRLDRLEHRP